MRLLVLSDLHLELKPRWSLRRRWPDYDVAVVAGDLAGSIALGVAILATHPVLGANTPPGNWRVGGGPQRSDAMKLWWRVSRRVAAMTGIQPGMAKMGRPESEW